MDYLFGFIICLVDFIDRKKKGFKRKFNTHLFFLTLEAPAKLP